MEAEEFWLGKKPIQSCQGCHACAKLHRCVFNDDCVNEFLELAADADGFIFGTPVHYAAADGAITCFMGRAFYADACGGDGRFYLKPAAGISVARRAGTLSTWDQLNKFFGISSMPIVTSQYWNELYGTNFAEAQEDVEGMQTMETLAKNMVYQLECQAAGKASGVEMPMREARKPMNFIH